MDLVRVLRPVTLVEARTSYAVLKAAPCTGIITLGRAGTPALDHFFLHHRLRAKTKNHLSFVDAMRDPARTSHLTELVGRYKKVDVTTMSAQELLRQQYYMFQLYYGTINQFRPLAAKHVYCQFKPTQIVDFSAGWGGRCLAAMSLGIPYIGIDSNTRLRPAYERMVTAMEPKQESSVQLFFQPAETFDFSQHTYDLVFTSPPYFRLEEYEKMPEYGSKQGFLDKFFRPVVVAAWAGLSPNGHLALNMPGEMFEAVRDLLPRLTRTIPLPVQNRHPKGAAKQGPLTDVSRGELIYVWRKTGEGATRRTRKQQTHRSLSLSLSRRRSP